MSGGMEHMQDISATTSSQVSGYAPEELESEFDTLLAADAGRRGQMLGLLTRENPALAQRLAALLDAHGRHAQDLEKLGEGARAHLGLLDADELLGRELDGWRLTELLGRGGMGVVFGAERAAATRS